MKRLLKISSITGSAAAPIASRFGKGSTRVMTTWFFGVIAARHPFSMTIVWCGSMMSAGPSTFDPIASASRKKTSASRHAPLEKTLVRRAGAGVSLAAA